MIQYAIVPGEVRAKDGDIHYISAERLVWLYKLKRRDCIIINKETDLRGYTQAFLEGLTWVYPREDGEYPIKEK